MNIFNWNQLEFAYAVFIQVSHFNAIEKYKWKEQKNTQKDVRKSQNHQVITEYLTLDHFITQNIPSNQTWHKNGIQSTVNERQVWFYRIAIQCVIMWDWHEYLHIEFHAADQPSKLLEMSSEIGNFVKSIAQNSAFQSQ